MWFRINQIRGRGKKQLTNEHLYHTLFRQYIELLEILRDLYQLGFVLISQQVNLVWGLKSGDPDGIYDLVEVVFMKK